MNGTTFRVSSADYGIESSKVTFELLDDSTGFYEFLTEQVPHPPNLDREQIVKLAHEQLLNHLNSVVTEIAAYGIELATVR